MNLAELPQAVEGVRTIAFGGHLFESKPMAAVLAICDAGLRFDLVYAGIAGALDIDLLAGAGLMKETRVPVVTFERRGLAPRFRAAVESGAVVAPPVDALTIAAGYTAGALGIPFLPVAAWRGTDMVKLNPLISKLVERAPDGGPLYGVSAIVPDVAVIHASAGDRRGNLRLEGPHRSLDRLLAKGARRVIATVETLLDDAAAEAEPQLTAVPAMYVDAVVHEPGGAWPTAAPAYYEADDDALDHYVRVGRLPEKRTQA